MIESKSICPWALRSAVERHYHDTEWGRSLHEERALFELLILEGMQAGLSWRTILEKRRRYREQFDGFDADEMARYTTKKIEDLMTDPGIVRNRAKIEGAIKNARAYLEMREHGHTLERWLWNWVNGQPIVNRWRTAGEVPTYTDLSVRISRELYRTGFVFVGARIVYAFMQATGLVNDHLECCPQLSMAATSDTKRYTQRRF